MIFMFAICESCSTIKVLAISKKNLMGPIDGTYRGLIPKLSPNLLQSGLFCFAQFQINFQSPSSEVPNFSLFHFFRRRNKIPVVSFPVHLFK